MSGASASRRASGLASDGSGEWSAPRGPASGRRPALASWCSRVPPCRGARAANPPPPPGSPAQRQGEKNVGHVRDPLLGRCQRAAGATGSHLVFKDVQSHRVLALVLAAPRDALGCVEGRCCSPCPEHWCPPAHRCHARLALTLVLQALLVLLGVVRVWLCLCLSLLPGKGQGMDGAAQASC